MPERLTRRRLVVAGAASAAGAALPSVPLHAGGAIDVNAIAGRFMRATGSHAAVVDALHEGSLFVTLDTDAYVAHGADGIVDSLAVFVPGEPVLVRGDRSGGNVSATEFQSIYTRVSGIYERDDDGHVLVTSSGQRVRVPDRVLERDAPAGIRLGDARAATVWTHPITRDAVAVDID